MFGIELAGGALIFLAFIVLYMIAVTYSIYSPKGSAISQRSCHKVYNGAPGSRRASSMGSNRDHAVGSWSRGCR